MNEREILIPEIIGKSDTRKKIINHDISLSQKNDNRKYDIQNTHNIHTSNTTINNQKSMGFFQFLVYLILSPFLLTYSILRFIYNKFDFYEKFKINQKKNVIKRVMLKKLKMQKSLWNNEEIF